MIKDIMGYCPVCYIPKFMEIESLVPRDKVFKAFQSICAWKPSGHVTNILSQDQEITLILNYHITLNYMSAPTTFQVTGCNSFEVFTFLDRKTYVTKFDLAINR